MLPLGRVGCYGDNGSLHNLWALFLLIRRYPIGVGAIMAAIAPKNAVIDFGLRGTIKIFGAPAEELCIGKSYMARTGFLNGVDAFIDWYPGSFNRANYSTCNAYFNIRYHFRGRTDHGNSPWYGRSALDAAILMGHMIEHLRHLK